MKQTKTILSMLCAAALFAACSSTDELEPVVQTGQQTAEEAVGFDVYTRGTQSTRAGYVGEMDQTAIRVAGFGVYGYVTPGKVWSTAITDTEKPKPDFMANQLVSYNSTSSSWVYAPLKYWPNQANTGEAAVDALGGGKATTTGSIDYVSFFAYAPYVATAHYNAISTAQTEAANETPTNDGILYVHQNDVAGSPKVVYRMADNPVNSVDLMYGVAAHAYKAADRYTGKNTVTDVVAGKPFYDMTKETVEDKIDFRFLHALTKLSVNVDAYFDEVRSGTTPGSNDVDPNTRIVIEDVILSTQQLAIGGTLDLDNTTASQPTWTSSKLLSACNTNTGYNLKKIVASNLQYVSGTETNVTYFAKQPLGVTKTKQSLIGYGTDGVTPASLMFVPTAETDEKFTVTLKYHVITRDSRLEKGFNEIVNNISYEVATWDFLPGKAYTLNLHIGMTSVKMDASVADWEYGNEQQVDLPANVGVSALTATTFTVAENGEITLTGAQATYTNNTTPVALTIADVFFTSDAEGTQVLPVEGVDTSNPADGVIDKYYIPNNYTAAARDIYFWYGGKSYKTAEGGKQAKLTATVAVTEPSTGNIAAKNGTATLKVAADQARNFDCNDWTVTAKVDTTPLEGVKVTGFDNAQKEFTLSIPDNPSSSVRAKITFTVTNGSVTATTAEISQDGSGS